ncbi:MAG: mono/diheme cytochrome c family protein [Candidatus Azotimanducaceae bacterium]|jgi:mono/diheme cytochrome c family protein
MKIFSMTTRKIYVAGLLVLALASCSSEKDHPGYEYFPDMYRSPSYETYAMSGVFKDSIVAQLPVEGTIPRGFMPFMYGASNEEYTRAGVELTYPATFESTEKTLVEGKELYAMFCEHCHGKAGNGDGTIIKNGLFPPPPSYSTGNSSRGGAMKDLSEGKIYHTITYGLNMMGPHASQLSAEERWKITRFVQELQGNEKAK